MAKISIVTLSYNQGAFLAEAIDSILSQNYSNLEYIIVDPGSTDNSREVVAGYANSISRTIFEPDQGAADGLNKGFSYATGEIFGFLNADDVLMPGSLPRVAAFFEQKPNCDIAFGGGHTIDAEGQMLGRIRARNFTARHYFYGGAAWLQQATFFRSSAFLRSPGFNVKNRTCWDGELFLTMVSQGAKVDYLDSDLAGFRIHAKSLTGSRNLQTQYRNDTERIFMQLYGRSWGFRDSVVKTACRTVAYLSRYRSR